MPSAETTTLEVKSETDARGAPIEAHASDGPGPVIAADPGLYAVLGLDPSASDAVIQTTYRRQAAKLLGSGSRDITALRQLNVAYEVLGNPVRRAEYDRARLTQSTSGAPTPIRTGPKVVTRVTPQASPAPRGTAPLRWLTATYWSCSMVVGLAVAGRRADHSAASVDQSVGAECAAERLTAGQYSATGDRHDRYPGSRHRRADRRPRVRVRPRAFAGTRSPCPIPRPRRTSSRMW